MNPTYPLISCICITNDRPALLQQAIKCFESQNYINRELVICCPKMDHSTKEIVQRVQQDHNLNVLLVERERDETLEVARNRAIYKCHGDYVCIWNNDDWHHSSRLSFQFNSMQNIGYGYKASILMRVFLYDYSTQLSYLSFSCPWDGTLFFKKELLSQAKYVYNQKPDEETHLIRFLDSKKLMAHIEESPFLYIYTQHGNNDVTSDRFKYLVNRSHILNDEVNNKIKSLLQE